MNKAYFFNALRMNRMKWIMLLLISYISITWLRFYEWRPLCLWGDDLHSYVIFLGKHLKNNLEYLPFLQEDLKSPFEKVRFVFHAVTYAEFLLFKQNILNYFIFNVIIHAVNGCLICLLAFRFSRVLWVSVALGMCAITSHFGLYEVAEITGHVESISLMFCLLSILSVIKAQKTELTHDGLWNSKWKWLSLMFAFLAFNTHERYIVMLPWLALFFVIYPKAGSILERLTFVFAESFLLFSNIIAKVFIYHLKFFQGTGGQPLSIDWTSIKNLATEAFFSTLGLNHGPEYLAGIDWTQFPHFIQQTTFLATVASLVLIIIALLPWRTKMFFGIGWPFYLFLLAILLLIPPILTIRIEQRWELASFDLVLLLIACGVRKLSLGRFFYNSALILVGCFIIGFGVEEWYLVKGFSKIFFVGEQESVAIVKKQIIDQHVVLPGTPLLFVAFPGACQWGLARGGLFLIYEGKARNIFCVDQLKDVNTKNYPANTKIFFFSARKHLEELNLNANLSP